ncbi:putative Dead box ATP-dependent RNA helicase [Quillaja saponaria]|uniref:Dead box ATP-dependent RNA helicase n=1 Tax=Quillaja saponaria TaxID=32244 RepID=A0AAD7LK84_QUISA|nr:putative Dead box ATP-dependent RNA helicase [Quillaja saponaria]
MLCLCSFGSACESFLFPPLYSAVTPPIAIKSFHFKSTCLYGGAPKAPQLKELDRGVDLWQRLFDSMTYWRGRRLTLVKLLRLIECLIWVLSLKSVRL